METTLPILPSVKHWKNFSWGDWLRVGAGCVMLVLGLAGLVLPVLQGALFLVVAGLLLSPYSRMAQRAQAWSKRRFPGVHRRVHEAAHRLTRLYRR